jgi:hypothetical protein
MSYKIQGKIAVIKDTQHVRETFKKREFVVEVIDNNYTELISLEVIQDKCDILNSYQVGMEVEAEFNLKGRKWTSPQGEDKYFNTLQAWRISNLSQQQGPAPAPYQQPQTPQFQQSAQGVDGDDLVPF